MHGHGRCEHLPLVRVSWEEHQPHKRTLATLNTVGSLTTKKRHVHSRLVQVGRDEGRWLCVGVLAIMQARTKVSRWARLSNACQVTAPRTCKGWVSEFIRVSQIFQDHRMFKDKS